MATINLSIRKILQIFFCGFFIVLTVFYLLLKNSNTNIDELLLLISTCLILLAYLYLRQLLSKTFQISSSTNYNLAAVEIHPFVHKISSLENEINSATNLINAMENGNLDLESTEANISQSGLYQSLLEMKTKMQKIAIEEKQRSWATEGLANFAELLRSNNNNIKELSHSIIGKLVNYLGMNQGGIFILRGTEPNQYLELTSCYAYNRKKIIEKRIEVGEGLIGQVVLEKEYIYLTNVPNGYTTITSGLGDATPDCVLITPLIINEEVYGVLELCSFDHIKQYQIDFINKLGESIAASIAAVITQEHTQALLKASQEQSIQLQSQEEEMKQNLEELHATQENMLLKENEIRILLEKSQENEKQLETKLTEINVIKEAEKIKTEKMVLEMELNKKIILKVIEELPDKIFLKDEEGRLVLINSALASGYNKPVEALLGTSDFDNFPHHLATEYRAIELEMLQSGKPMTMYENFPDASGETKILYCVKMPFQFPGTEKTGILGYQVDVTEIKTLENKIKTSEEAMKKREAELLEKIETQLATIVSLNEKCKQ
ncbi:MAG: PAS domain S-box protein [Cytophagales bacterium]|nr:MAG: PAS domain S-box protein [Cytophagales bacterium]